MRFKYGLGGVRVGWLENLREKSNSRHCFTMTDKVNFCAPLISIDDLCCGRAIVYGVRRNNELTIGRPIKSKNVRGARALFERAVNHFFERPIESFPYFERFVVGLRGEKGSHRVPGYSFDETGVRIDSVNYV